jgi:hypothetical protein
MTLDRIGASPPSNYAICTSSTHPPSPVAGTLIYETDTNTLQLYSGSAWVQVGPITAGWTSWTPTVTSGSGTITTLGTVTAAYQRIGRTINWRCTINITTNGTAASNIQFTLPVTAAAAQYLGSGAEWNLSGKTIRVYPPTGPDLTKGQASYYDNTYPGGSGTLLYLAGTYEAAS